MNPNDEKNLEAFIHRTLRALPERQAPATLEHRVLDALAARKTQPWWSRSFSRWPVPARLGFGAVSLSLVAALLVSGSFGSVGVSNILANLKSDLSPARAVFHALSSLVVLCGDLFARIPSLYLYGGIAAIALFYVALFGIGTTAYRTFFAKR
jgi:hypothetical protein